MPGARATVEYLGHKHALKLGSIPVMTRNDSWAQSNPWAQPGMCHPSSPQKTKQINKIYLTWWTRTKKGEKPNHPPPPIPTMWKPEVKMQTRWNSKYFQGVFLCVSILQVFKKAELECKSRGKFLRCSIYIRNIFRKRDCVILKASLLCGTKNLSWDWRRFQLVGKRRK